MQSLQGKEVAGAQKSSSLWINKTSLKALLWCFYMQKEHFKEEEIISWNLKKKVRYFTDILFISVNQYNYEVFLLLCMSIYILQEFSSFVTEFLKKCNVLI